MKAIYKRELGSYFQSMTGYLFISVLTASGRNLFHGI